MTRSRFFSLDAWGVSSPFDPTFHYVSSPFLTPVVLAAFRLLFAVYTLITTIVTLADAPSSYFSYFTDLSYVGLVAYFWASGVQSVAFVLRKHKSYPLQSWHRVLQLLHVILYSTVTVFPIVVTAVFWSLLASSATFSTRYSAWANVSRHAMNTVMALFEILCTHGGPSPWMHVVLLILILLFYLAIAYITRATQGFYTYSFLNPTKEGAFLAVYIVGIAVGCIVVFALVKGVCALRRWTSLRYGLFLDDSRPEALDEWEEMAVPKESYGDA